MWVYKACHCKQEQQLQSLIKKALGISLSKDQITALLGKGLGIKAGWEASSEDVFPSKPSNQLSDDVVFMFSYYILIFLSSMISLLYFGSLVLFVLQVLVFCRILFILHCSKGSYPLRRTSRH